MKLKHTDRTLESFPYFPVAAWVITFFSALFVYNTTQELRALTDQLAEQTQSNEAVVTDTRETDS